MIFGDKTKIYTVHINPTLENPLEKAIFVREGFNLMAFVLGVVWALYYRLWMEAILLAAIMVFLGAADEKNWLSASTVMVLNFAVNAVVGLWANDMRRANISRRGYIMSDVVVSNSELAAQQRYFERVAVA